MIAKKADGALRDALGLLDQAIAFCGDHITYKAVLKALNVVGSDRLFEFMSCVSRQDTSAGLHLIHTLLQEGYDIQEFLVGLVEHLRNLYVAKQGEQMILIEASADTKANYFEAASTLDSTDIMRYLYLVSEQQVKIKELSQPRIAFELMFLKMAHMEPLDGLKNLIEGVKNLPSGTVNVHTSPSAKHPDNDDASQVDSEVGTTQEIRQRQEPSEELAASPKQDAKPAAQPTPEPAPERSTTPAEPKPKKNSLLDEVDLGIPSLGNSSQVNTGGGHRSTENEIKPESTQKVTQDTTSSKSGVQLDKNPSRNDEDTEAKSDAEDRQNQLSFDTIIAEWPSLKGLDGRIPKILELQVERVKPVELLADQLILECDNPLSKQMLDQQARELSVLLKKHIGVMVRLQININNKKTAQTKEKNPYEFFKELVQKDPILKDIVDKLGAELEY